jgi:hypothetical protein
MKGILLAAQIEGISTRKDRTIKIILGTQEISPSKGGELLSLSDKVVSVYLNEAVIDDKEIAQVDAINPEFQGKTQSQRLRNVLFLNWQNNNKGYKDFNAYYQSETETIITHYKNKLP